MQGFSIDINGVFDKVPGYIAVGAARLRIHPVSYTHLDVYKRQVLVFPYAKGSCGWAKAFQNMAHFHANPAAMIVVAIDNRSALGAVTMRTPTVTDVEGDPLTVIETGDWVDVNADEGLILSLIHICNGNAQ